MLETNFLAKLGCGGSGVWTEAVVVPSWWFRFPQPRWGSLCQLGSVTIDRGLGRTRKTTRESEMLMFCNRRSRKGGVV